MRVVVAGRISPDTVCVEPGRHLDNRSAVVLVCAMGHRMGAPGPSRRGSGAAPVEVDGR